MATTWNPDVYARYADERSRPFFDLVQRIRTENPRRVVDLGCGTGVQTATLAGRWPDADILGLDSSADMVAGRPSALPPRVRIEQGDIAAFTASGIDVVVSNAALQWVPSHRELVSRWADELNDGGTLAWQVPGNFGAPSHVLMRELAESPEWSPQLSGVLRGSDSTDSADAYAARLQAAGLTVDAWETTYVHVLQGDDPVLRWVRGTGLRPVLDALDDADRGRFEATYAQMLREAYPQTAQGTLFPFRRIFVVGYKSVE